MRVDPESQHIDYSGEGFAIGDNGVLLKNLRMYEVTLDVASLADDADAQNDVTCTGVALGDMVLSVTHKTANPGDGYVLYGHVSAADTVNIFAMNKTGGVVDLASATYRVLVAQTHGAG